MIIKTNLFLILFLIFNSNAGIVLVNKTKKVIKLETKHKMNVSGSNGISGQDELDVNEIIHLVTQTQIFELSFLSVDGEEMHFKNLLDLSQTHKFSILEEYDENGNKGLYLQKISVWCVPEEIILGWHTNRKNGFGCERERRFINEGCVIL